MKKLILSLALLSSIGMVNAAPINLEAAREIQKNITANMALQGDSSTEVLKNILDNSPLYALILALDTELPKIARAAEFVMIINELHHMNETLDVIAKSLQNTSTAGINNPAPEGALHG